MKVSEEAFAFLQGVSEVLGNDRYMLGNILRAERTRRTLDSVFTANNMKPWCNMSDVDEVATIVEDHSNFKVDLVGNAEFSQKLHNQRLSQGPFD